MPRLFNIDKRLCHEAKKGEAEKIPYLIKEVQNATFPLYGGLAFHKCLLHFAGWAGGGSSDKGGEKEDLRFK